jgi:CHAT domain-containing protein
VLNWCPTGLFSFLPIHAAGIYDGTGHGIDCASHYMISSFTPTIGALLVPEQQKQPSTHPFEFLAVIQAQTLRFAKEELRRIEARIPAHSLIKLGTPDSPPANVDAVVNGLSTASIVHFACHGEQDDEKPLKSALILQDGRLPVSRIMQQPLPGGSLAFLSAC